MADFVIQKHYTRNLVWFLYLEMDGVRVSWACMKEPPTTDGGRIPVLRMDKNRLDISEQETNNIGRSVHEEWDKGDCRLIDKNDYKLLIDFNGSKLKGVYVLVQMTGREWLFFKR